MNVLWTSKTGDIKVTFSRTDVSFWLHSQVLTEDGWTTTDSVALRRQAASVFIPLLAEFVADRPNQVHNNIEWRVQDSIVALNGVPAYALPSTGKVQQTAAELVSSLLTANRTTALFTGIPPLSDVESELWIATRINTIAEASEF